MQVAFCPESSSQLLFPFGRPLCVLFDINCCNNSEDIFSFGSFLLLLFDVSYIDEFERLFAFERSILVFCAALDIFQLDSKKERFRELLCFCILAYDYYFFFFDIIFTYSFRYIDRSGHCFLSTLPRDRSLYLAY